MLYRILCALLALGLAGQVAAFETRARAAYVFDVTSGTVLFEKDADLALPPASMSKLMTLNMLFEAIRDGRVTLETRFTVSTKAKNMGGSTMFLNERDRPTVEELILGIIVQSGNDATVVVAEGLAGTEDAFARTMNERARALGMTHSTFANASGWPNPNHRMSMRDLGILATRLIDEFPEFYGYFSLKEWEFDGRAPQNRFNRNPLLQLGNGADGLKTGHTQEAGYGLVGSALQGNRRVVIVLTGLASEKDRSEEAERVISWAFRQFAEKKVVSGGKILAEAEVWLGDQNRVGLAVAEDVTLLVPALVQEELPAEIVFRAPIRAPVAKGDQIAELVIARDGLTEARIPLVADRDVARGGFLPRLRAATTVLMDRFLSEEESETPVIQ